MPTLSPVEIAVVALIALVVFGPEKLPDIARTIGRTLTQLRRMADDARTEFRAGFEEPVADEPEEGPDADADAAGQRSV